MSWPQQLCETQSPHASPVMGQIGGGPPHFPPLHSFEQHCVSWLHAIPSARHAGGPHVPLLHWPEQQVMGPLQSAPSGAHCWGPQTPPLHWALQQSVPLVHGTPSAAQFGGPQVPSLHCPPQQSAASAQDFPLGLQSTQAPFVQLELQQSDGCSHVAPGGAHAPQGMPQIEADWLTQRSLQLSVQQLGFFSQICATHGSQDGVSGSPGTQRSWVQPGVGPQSPLLQVFVQQSAPDVQV